MLRPRHTALNLGPFRDDSNPKMSLKHHNAKANGTAPAMTPSQLAHELNNLLDGSLRHVGMVIRELKDLDADPDAQGQIEQRLSTANQSMRQMADVIERYANPGSSPGSFNPADQASTRSAESSPSAGDLVATRGTLRDIFTHAINVYGPLIQQHDIELVTHLDAAIADLPAGPVYTVLANAINNAVQAIQRCDVAGVRHRLEVCFTPTEHDVLLKVTDTGVGLDPVLFDRDGRFRFGVTTRRNGHGIGLGVCRQIAHDLDGQLQLSANPAGRGTQLTLQYPHPAQANQESRRAG